MPQNNRPMSAFEARQARSAARSADTGILPSVVAEKRGPSSPLMGASKRAFAGARGNASTSDKGGLDASESSGEDPELLLETDSEAADVVVLDDDRALSDNDRLISKRHPRTQIQAKDNGALEVYLEPGDQLTIVGQYAVWVLSGAVRILGALLLPSNRTVMVFAPSTHSLPAIEHVKSPAHVIIFSTHPGLRGLGRISKSFKNLWNHRDGTTKSFTYLERLSDDRKGRDLKAVHEPAVWRQAMTNIVRGKANQQKRVPAVLIYGPRNCGKSTFARILVNRFLTSPNDIFEDGVFYLDLDPGQPEYSAPGDISLTHVRELNLGPSYTHPLAFDGEGNATVWAHHIGDTTSENDTEYFLACVDHLYSIYSKGAKNVPLIINGCGWTEGKGLELMEKVVKLLDLTDTVIFAIADSIAPYEQVASKGRQRDCTLHRLPFKPHKTKAARELRTMQAMSYFHANVPHHPQPSWDSQSLLVDRGEMLSYGVSAPDIYGVMVYGPRVARPHLPIILDRTICALVVVDAQAMSAVRRDPASSHAIPILYPGDNADTEPFPPSHSRSLGQVFIRSIDTKTRTMHVITPLSLEQTIAETRRQEKKLVLVRGRLEAPAWVYNEVMEEMQSNEKDVLEWDAYRLRQLQSASNRKLADQVNGPGQEPTTDDDLDLRVEGEEEFGSEFYAAQLPWVDVDLNGGHASESNHLPKIGGKKWRVRRNLVVGAGNPAP